MSNIIIKGSPTDLTVLELLSPADLFSEGGTLPVYEAIKKEVSTFVPDISSEAGRKEVAALAFKIAKSKTFLDNVGKTYNAKLKEMPKAIDKERKVIWDKLEAMQAEIRKPLTEWEEKEKARVDEHKAAMAELENLSQFLTPPTIEQINAGLSRGGELKLRDWQEFSDMASPVFERQYAKLMTMKFAAEQAEKDRIELEALRAAKAEQEAKDAEASRIADEEAQRARIEREATERAMLEAAAAIKAAEENAAKQKADDELRIRQAEDAKIAAEAKAKADAELAVQRERDRAAAEQKKLDDEAKERENNRAHHAKINNEVMAALSALDCVLGEVPAKAITVAIAEGKIPHVKISY